MLHFFANHELLATELMALVLLKFPEAPPAFRRGVLATLKDEQEHTRLYLERMKACGIEFGELPVSGWFWRCVAPMEHPMDYVARLSLTFEQANLDFSRHFANGFTAVGDAPTAALLEHIHRDEVAHVAYGLKWFRRWKNPAESDWDAFCKQLKFPLTPRRARGFQVNVEGRKAAGLDEDFIAHLEVQSQSKGRTPTVLLFNPFAEGYVAGGAAFTPVKHQAQLALDLENLPQFLSRQDDIVLVNRAPSTAFLQQLKRSGFDLPEFVELSDTPSLTNRKLGQLRPWAWGPDSVRTFEPLAACVTGETRPLQDCFNPKIAKLYSKAWSAGLLRTLLKVDDAQDRSSWLCDADVAGEEVSSVDEALQRVRSIRERGHHRVVVKEAVGLAGHNAIRLWEPEVLPAQIRWMERAFASSQTLVVEPWLERVIDFSVQYEMTGRGLQLVGYTGLLNDLRGQYRGNWAAPNCNRRLPDAVTQPFTEPRDAVARIHALYDDLRALLEAELRDAGYLGPVGVDALVYRDAKGKARLKPVVEINPRFTMGRVTLELMKHTTPGSHGLFRLINPALAKREGHPDLSFAARAMTEVHPLQLSVEPASRIHEGTVCLNDPATAQVCLAVFQVTRTSADLPFESIKPLANSPANA